MGNLKKRDREIRMPLTRGVPIGYDAQLMVLRFSMMNGNRVVFCEISKAAMDRFLNTRRGVGAAERAAIFIQFRDAIERLASDIWDESRDKDVVRIFYKQHRTHWKGTAAEGERGSADRLRFPVRSCAGDRGPFL